jgi:3-phosphoglycerate kinase
VRSLPAGYRKPCPTFIAILGGAKSDKIGLFEIFLDKADQVLIGGGWQYIFKVRISGGDLLL